MSALEREPAMMGASTQEAFMARKARMFLDHAVDLWIASLVGDGKAEATRTKYRWVLDKFLQQYEHLTPREVTADHCRLFLSQWADNSASTLALHHTVLKGFFKFLEDEEIIPLSPMHRIPRARRLRPEDVDVVSVSREEVRRIFDGCQTWQELLCIACLIYLGPRRNALSKLRRRDADLEAGMMTFREKGRKVIRKPIPHELASILRAADEDGVWKSPGDYLVPSRKPWLVKRDERANRVIYDTVVEVADRVGIRSHVHALRAAFAVAFDEAHPDKVISLKELLGHSRIETTLVYLRRKNKAAAMEDVRDLSWGSVLPESPVKPPAGFEPAFQAKPHEHRHTPATSDVSLAESLQARVSSLAEHRERKRRVR